MSEEGIYDPSKEYGWKFKLIFVNMAVEGDQEMTWVGYANDPATALYRTAYQFTHSSELFKKYREPGDMLVEISFVERLDGRG